MILNFSELEMSEKQRQHFSAGQRNGFIELYHVFDNGKFAKLLTENNVSANMLKSSMWTKFTEAYNEVSLVVSTICLLPLYVPAPIEVSITMLSVCSLCICFVFFVCVCHRLACVNFYSIFYLY